MPQAVDPDHIFDQLAVVLRQIETGQTDIVSATKAIQPIIDTVIHCPEADMRHLQSQLAAVRQLLPDHRPPADILRDAANNRTFLGGALWAMNSLMEARLTDSADTPHIAPE